MISIYFYFNKISVQRIIIFLFRNSVDDRRVVSRSCYWENVNARRNDCAQAATPSNIRTISCETCHTDGCNRI